MTEQTHENDLAAIFFTSGSTGAPKGVEALYRHMKAQMENIEQMLEQRSDDVDLAAFPLSMLASPAIGRTCVIPNLGSIHPMKCKPENIIQSINDFGITACFASPVVWERLSLFCVNNNLQLPTLRYAISGGAAIPISIFIRPSRISSAVMVSHRPTFT